MALADVQNEIIEPMQRVYTPPARMDDDRARAALRDYGDALQGFNSAVLRQAWQNVRDSYTLRSWPAPGLFVKAAIGAKKEQRTRDPQAQYEGFDYSTLPDPPGFAKANRPLMWFTWPRSKWKQDWSALDVPEMYRALVSKPGT